MPESEIDYRGWVLALYSLLDEIELGLDNEALGDLLRLRFSIAEEYGMTVKFLGPAQRGPY